MKPATPALRLDRSQARALFLLAQGLPPARGAKLLPTLERTGLVRTLGGVEAYLALLARVPGLRRTDVDAAVEAGDVRVLPAARGCMYLVPRRDVPVALRFADHVSRAGREREQEKAGVRPGELRDAGDAIVATLRSKGPLGTDALKKALPAGAVRSLGDAGKKVGLSSTLPSALRTLEFEGRIERTPHEHRLDNERYLWRVAAASPFDGASVPDDLAGLVARMAGLFFRAAGAATVKQLAEWAGVSQRDALAAATQAGVVPVEIEGLDGAVMLAETAALADDLERAASAAALLPFADNLTELHGGPAFLVDDAHHAIEVPIWGSTKKETLGDAKHVAARTAVAAGRIVALWEVEPGECEVALACFDARAGADARAALDDAARAVTSFLVRDLGHGRSFSLDTDDALRERAAWIRSLAPARKKDAGKKKKPAGAGRARHGASAAAKRRT